jgi:hypothetical protein
VTPEHTVPPPPMDLAERLRRFGPENPDDARAPLHWPSAPPGVAAQEWPGLLEWVEGLRSRYEAFDEKVLPPCWYRHACYVGALQALCDFERIAYARSAPGSAGVDWHRALRDIEGLIARWSAGPVACVGGHKDARKPLHVDDKTFAEFLREDLAARTARITEQVRKQAEECTT